MTTHELARKWLSNPDIKLHAFVQTYVDELTMDVEVNTDHPDYVAFLKAKERSDISYSEWYIAAPKREVLVDRIFMG